MKRTRIDGGEGEFLTLDMARSLVLLSQQSLPVGWSNKKPKMETAAPDSMRVGNVFECKTCGRTFSSFQALGGHRASHKLMQKKSMKPHSEPTAKTDTGSSVSADKPRMHECTICGLGFAMGQALGGHMRKHRTDLMNGYGTAFYPTDPIPTIPVLKRTNSNKRIACLDLNLTPLENDLKLLFGNVAPHLQLQKQQF